jgi:hypothetical protein
MWHSLSHNSQAAARPSSRPMPIASARVRLRDRLRPSGTAWLQAVAWAPAPALPQPSGTAWGRATAWPWRRDSVAPSWAAWGAVTDWAPRPALVRRSGTAWGVAMGWRSVQGSVARSAGAWQAVRGVAQPQDCLQRSGTVSVVATAVVPSWALVGQSGRWWRRVTDSLRSWVTVLMEVQVLRLTFGMDDEAERRHVGKPGRSLLRPFPLTRPVQKFCRLAPHRRASS